MMNTLVYRSNIKPLYNVYQCIYCSDYHINVTKYCNRHRRCYDKYTNCCNNYVLDELLNSRHDKHDIIPCNNICNIRCWINKYITTTCQSHSCLNCNEVNKNNNYINSFTKILKEYGSFSNKNNYIVLSKYLFCNDSCYNEYTSSITKIIDYNSIILNEKIINEHNKCTTHCNNLCRMLIHINKKKMMNENITHCYSCTKKLSDKNITMNNIMLIYLKKNDIHRLHKYLNLKRHIFCNQKCFSEYFIAG